MDRLGTVRRYARIVELGSFTAAAGDFGMPSPILPAHVLYASQRQMPARLRVFVN